MAGRLGGWLAGGLTWQNERSEPLYIPLEPRFLRPGRLGWLGGWEAGWLAVKGSGGLRLGVTGSFRLEAGMLSLVA